MAFSLRGHSKVWRLRSRTTVSVTSPSFSRAACEAGCGRPIFPCRYFDDYVAGLQTASKRRFSRTSVISGPCRPARRDFAKLFGKRGDPTPIWRSSQPPQTPGRNAFDLPWASRPSRASAAFWHLGHFELTEAPSGKSSQKRRSSSPGRALADVYVTSRSSPLRTIFIRARGRRIS